MLKNIINDKPLKISNNSPDLVKEPVKEPIKEPVKKPVKEPVKKPVKKPVKDPVKKPVKSVKKNSNKSKDIVDLRTIFKPGYVFEIGKPVKKYTVIKPIVEDEAPSIVLLVKSNEKEYIIKVELLGTPNPQIYNEESVLFWINNNRGINETKDLLKDKSFIKGGIPKMYSRLIMYQHPPDVKTRLFIEEKLDGSLSQYIKNKKISIPEIKKIGSEYIKILQYIHANGYIHLDIKPPNLMIKKENGINKYYIIDFGIAKKWYSQKYVKGGDNTYYILNKPSSGEGTALYKSINAERASLRIKGSTLSRNEDIEAIGYILIEMSLGELPWKSYDSGNSEERLKLKLNSNEYIKKITDDNLKKAITLMVTNYDKPYDYEPEYKRLLDLLK